MSFIGIGSPIPDIVNLPGQTGGEIEVTLDYPSASACDDASPFSPSEATPPGGTFAATPSGLNINASTGEVTPVGSTPQAYTISYTVSGVTSSFALTINAVQQSTFSYASSSFENSGTALPTLAGGTTSGGTFTSSSPSDLPVNSSTGELDLSSSTVGGPYTITYTTPGPCATSSTFQVSITAAYASTSSFTFDGVNDYILTNLTPDSYTGFSISAWVYADSLGSYNVVASQYRANNPSNSAWFLETINSNMAFGVVNGTTLKYAQKAFSTLGWYHVVGVWDGSTVEVYIDGAASGSPQSISAMNTGTVNMAIGGLWNIGGTAVDNGFWDGKIDEVSIWDSGLSSAAVTEIYNSGAPNDLTNLTNASSSNLKAWYKMGE
jgi:hypothetical protein